MAWSIIIALLVVGILFVLLEILVIPGVGVAGIIGAGMIGVSIWQSYMHDPVSGHIVLAIAIVASIISLTISLRARTWKRVALNTDVDGKVNTEAEENVTVGDKGIAISRLVPAGKAFINNVYIEVRTKGEFVDQNTQIEVTKVEHNKVFVKTVDE